MKPRRDSRQLDVNLNLNPKLNRRTHYHEATDA